MRRGSTTLSGKQRRFEQTTVIYLLLAVAMGLSLRSVPQVHWDNLDQHAIRADYIGIQLGITMVNQGYGSVA